jgi:ABC-type nitrate/sulfonate/bicarbonate transport system substrate-binding protein
MRRSLLSPLLAASLMLPLTAEAATPMRSVVNADIRDCRYSAGSPIAVPLITWGADLVTIAANGGAGTTAGSLAGQAGLSLKLTRQDAFPRQVEAYLRCDSPFLRATVGMAASAADLTQADPRTELVAIYQHSWSAGGDALVAKGGIKNIADLRGKTVALQSYGPHVELFLRILSDAGLQPGDVTIRWTKDIVGLKGDTPAAALSKAGVDAAFLITPDALALTSGGGTGTGAEDSIAGATVLFSTRTANRVIADMYFVRRDFLDANRETVQRFVQVLLQSEEKVRDTLKAGGKPAAALLRDGAGILLDGPDLADDMKALWSDGETVGFAGNVRAFTDSAFPRRYEKLVSDVQPGLNALGLVQRQYTLAAATWDWQALSKGLRDTAGVTVPRFDAGVAQQIISNRAAQSEGGAGDGTLFSFEIRFKPNQKTFPVDLYREQFNRVIDLASTYAGAIISVEGHADPTEYLRKAKAGAEPLVLAQQIQSGRNLSIQRATAVRDSLVAASKQGGIWLDESQFTLVGAGYLSPATGLCGKDDRGTAIPCAPKTEGEWLSNMRVVFKVIQVEAESNVFRPL